ncbi:hypothetical protein APC81_04000, partial [Acinetobacter baumannii]
MNLTNFQKKLMWGVGILSIICLWIVFPLVFKALIDSYRLPSEFKDLGPFGDIYGSLNTLISSIALCAVAYSTYLQVTSLKDTRDVNTRQLALAQQAHDEQVKESRNAIFANKFYSLLNYKKDKLNSIVLIKITNSDEDFPQIQKRSGLEAIDELSSEFHSILKKNNYFYSGCEIFNLMDEFNKLASNLGYVSLSQLISYF